MTKTQIEKTVAFIIEDESKKFKANVLKRLNEALATITSDQKVKLKVAKDYSKYRVPGVTLKPLGKSPVFREALKAVVVKNKASVAKLRKMFPDDILGNGFKPFVTSEDPGYRDLIKHNRYSKKGIDTADGKIVYPCTQLGIENFMAITECASKAGVKIVKVS